MTHTQENTKMPPPRDSWPDTNPDRPSSRDVGVAGRYPHRPGSLKAENFSVHITEYGDATVIRLEDEAHPDFWMEIILRTKPSDEVALSRMADDGCPLGDE